MNYGEILTKAWKITWKHKILWLFALLAGCAINRGGGGGNSSGNFNNSFSNGSSGGPSGNPFGELQGPFNQFSHWLSSTDSTQIILIIVGVVLLFFIINIAIYLLGLIGLNGLINGAWHADDGQEHLEFSELFRSGTHTLLRVFLMRFLVGMAIFIVILILIIPVILIGVATNGVGLLAVLPFAIIFICLAALLGIALEFFLNLANIAIVGEDISIMNGARRAWAIIKTGIGPLLLMALIIFIGGGIIQFVLALPMLFAVIPLFFGGMASVVSSDPTGLMAGGGVALAVCCLYSPVYLLATSILTTYTESLWVLIYKRVAAMPAKQSLPQPVYTPPSQ